MATAAGPGRPHGAAGSGGGGGGSNRVFAYNNPAFEEGRLQSTLPAGDAVVTVKPELEVDPVEEVREVGGWCTQREGAGPGGWRQAGTWRGTGRGGGEGPSVLRGDRYRACSPLRALGLARSAGGPRTLCATPERTPQGCRWWRQGWGGGRPLCWRWCSVAQQAGCGVREPASWAGGHVRRVAGGHRAPALDVCGNLHSLSGCCVLPRSPRLHTHRLS